MIYTSYFAKLRSLSDRTVPISICAKAPDWYTGAQYKVLAPKYDFFMKWKENHDNDYYTRCFEEQVLSPLCVQDVLDALFSRIPSDKQELLMVRQCPWWESPDVDVILLCYEKPDSFCHRHLVADWFRENGIECEEFTFGK